MDTPKWLDDAVFYNVYPQSFYDANGDGIGDLEGICQKLYYISDMGFNAIWLNPVYESPFRDGGYDVTDFYKIASRYGTNEDFATLCKEAKKRGIKIIMDLVAGHTSIECEWFKKSALPEKNEYTNRYIWTNSIWDKGDNNTFISGFSDRDGCYLNNFFYCQPALNYGYKNITQPWQLPMNHPDCMKMRDELLAIMDFWCDLGADGFRVDMAHSLIKNDPDGSGLLELWQYLRTEFKKRHPECVLVSEWSNPDKAINAGFDIDFLLPFGNKAYTLLFGYIRTSDWSNMEEDWLGNWYFDSEGKGDIHDFLDIYMQYYDKTRNKGYISIPTGNHDLQRSSVMGDAVDLKIAYTFILTMPGVPFVYYGDEIGMKQLKGLPSKEGGYNRTGARTPMQWDEGKNYAFSQADVTYLPVDNSDDAPTVAEQLKNDDSLLNYTKHLIKIRHENPALHASGAWEIIEAGYPFVYKRENILVIINPKDEACEVKIDGNGRCIADVNAEIVEGAVRTKGKGAAVVLLD